MDFMNILKRIILVNSWPNGNRKFRVFDVDGGAILQGGNGVGKTSTLILPLLFFGARPSDVMKASKKKKDKFVSRYLPTDSSYIAFEYVKNNQSKLVIVHSQDGENLHYLFCEAEFSDKLFLDESSNFVKIENLRNHLSITHGVSVFKKRFSVMDYREIIQSAKRLPASHKDYKSINEAKARFSLCENNESIAGSEKVAISIISSKPSFQSIKELIAQEIEIFDIGVQDQLSKETNVKELQKQATVIRQAKGFLKHENSVRQLSIHSRAIKNLEDELAILKFQAVQRLKSQDLNLTQAQSEKDILTKEFVDYEAKHNEVSRQYNEDISQLKGDIKDVENRISVLKDKYQSYQENGIEDKRRKGDAVNDLENELAVLNKQMESLNGSFEKIESLYQRQIDELDKSLARRLKEEENRLSALKDKEIQEQEKIREKMQEFLEILSTSHDENLKKIIDDQTNIKVEIGKLQQIASSPSSPEIKRITKEIDQLNQQLSEKTSLRNSIHEQLMDVYKNRSENDREIDINRGQEDKCHRDLESLHKSIEECNKSLENVDSMLFFKIAKLSAHKANIASRALTIGLLKTPVKEDVQVFDDGDNRLLGIDFDTNHLPPQEILDKSQLENRLSRLEQAKQEQIDTQQKIFRKRKELDQQSHELNQKKNRLEVELGVLKNKIEQINLQTTKSENDLKTEAKIKKEQTKKALQEHEVLLEGLKGKELSLRDDYEATKAKIKDGAQNELTESKNRMADKKAEFDRYKSEQLISHQNELAELEIRKRADLNAEGAPIEAIENCRNAIYKKTEILRDAKEAKEEYEKYSIWFELEYSRLPVDWIQSFVHKDTLKCDLTIRMEMAI
jgi:hypothetical protein